MNYVSCQAFDIPLPVRDRVVLREVGGCLHGLITAECDSVVLRPLKLAFVLR